MVVVVVSDVATAMRSGLRDCSGEFRFSDGRNGRGGDLMSSTDCKEPQDKAGKQGERYAPCCGLDIFRLEQKGTGKGNR